MVRCKFIISLIMYLGMASGVMGQSDSLSKHKRLDTIPIPLDQITPIAITCPVLSGGRGGADGLVVVNSTTDVNEYFGYNCTFPDVDFDTKTLLYITLNFSRELPYKIRTFKGQVIFSAYVCNVPGPRRTISVLIPKIDPDSGVLLDVNQVDCTIK